MAFRKGRSGFRYAIYYIVAIVVIFGCVVMAASFSQRQYVSNVKGHILDEESIRLERDADVIEDFVTKEFYLLDASSRVIDYMMASGASVGEIQEFLQKKMALSKKITDSLSGTFFGVIDSVFVHGDNWRPSEGYIPTRRPWYKEAVRSRGKIVLGKPFAGSRNTEPILFVSKSLQDRKSVITLTIPLISLNKLVASKNDGRNDIWMIMDKDGLVLASSGEIRQGINCLSSEEAWGKDEEKLAREVLLSGQKPFTFNYRNKDYSTFSTVVQDKWYMVRLVDNETLFSELYWSFACNVLVYVLIFVALAFLCTCAFWNRSLWSRTVKEKSLFLENLSKELRTPLNGMLSMTRILLRNMRNNSQKDYVKDLQVASIGLLSMVHDMQEIAKIENNELELNLSQYDIYSVLKDCFDTVSSKATAKNLHFSLECDPDIPSSLWGDEDRIRQIIVNLLSNSILFTEVGEVRLSVGYDFIPSTTDKSLDESINLKFTVRDSGFGVRDENPHSWFDLFNLGKPKKSHGSRFSLDLTKRLISLCGGEMIVKSRFGEGSSYMVTIPQLVLNIEPMGDFATRYRNDTSVDRYGPEALFAPEARILAVDDAELNLRVICGLLKETRVQIDTALNGAQCLDMVKSKHYDLILLDNLMPNMDGPETCERMMRMADNLNKETPVIMLVAGPNGVDKDSYLNAGFTDFVPKPLMEEDLLRVLRWYLPKHLILTREDLKGTVGMSLEAEKTDDTVKAPAFDDVASVPVQEMAGDADFELNMVTTLKPAERMSQFDSFLNVKSGMEYCINDEGFYVEMLSEYVTGDQHAAIESAFNAQDWANYRIAVHSLKSTSLTIGADELSGEAKALEMACKESRFDYVKDNHERVMKMYTDIVRKIKEGLERR